MDRKEAAKERTEAAPIGTGIPEAETTPPPRKNDAEAKRRRRRRRLRALRSLLLRLVCLALVIYVLLFHIAGLTVMARGDMVPRMDSGDMILFYRLDQSWKAQDVVVVDKAVNADFSAAETARREKPWWRKALDFLKIPDPEDPPTSRFVLRVVAVPGDTVEVTDNHRLIINGNAMIESGIYYQTDAYAGYTEYPVRLGADEYFVMADFRSGGADSRYFGPVTKDEIQGTVITVIRRNNL